LIRVCVGDARNVSWSFFDRILFLGIIYVQLDVSGGEGRAGVSGTGVGLPVSDRRRRGSSLGILFLRLGIAGAASLSGAGDVDGFGDAMIEPVGTAGWLGVLLMMMLTSFGSSTGSCR
jgi:hypothetical protein